MLRRKQYDSAIRYANCAVQASPDASDGWAKLAAVCFQAGRAAKDRDKLQQAVKYAEKALQLDPKSQAAEVKSAAQAALNQLGS
jgi:tetratricopeptide (TPR) repeat protein